MLILGIETSCDETAAALVEINSTVEKEKIKIISNVVSSQIKIHQKYGGIVPEVAARAHLEKILTIVTKALGNNKKKIDLISVTIGPGLITSLLVGIETAKTLAYTWNKPIIGINHLEGHIYANWLKPVSEISNYKLQTTNCKLFPALCLIVSGGHTELILMKDHLKYKKIGQTKDDAAGEAFDKTARLLNLEYPGGPAIAINAAKFLISSASWQIQFPNSLRCPSEQEFKISLPRPMINSGDYNFSFSGLKTAVLYQLKTDKNWKEKIPEYCYEFQQAVIDVLISKTLKAAKEHKVKTIILAGGVVANNELQKQFKHRLKVISDQLKANLLIPEKNLCGDNAAMIAMAGYFNALKNKYTPWQKLKPNPNLEL